MNRALCGYRTNSRIIFCGVVWGFVAGGSTLAQQPTSTPTTNPGASTRAAEPQPKATLATTQPISSATPASQPAAPVRASRLLWKFPLKAASFGSAAAGDLDGDNRPEIVLGTNAGDDYVYALNGEDGSLLWRFKVDGPVNTSVLIYDVTGDGKLEVLFGSSAYGTIFCLNGKGEIVWKYNGPSATNSPAAAADLDGDGNVEVVYGTMSSPGQPGCVVVLDGKSGKPVWSARVPGHVECEPGLLDVNGDGTLDVLVNNWMGDNRLRALDGRDGSELWIFETSDSVYHGVSFYDFHRNRKPEIIVANRRGTVWMLEAATGKKIWEVRLDKEREGSVFAPTSLVDSDRDGTPEIVVCGLNVHCLDVSGRLLWRNEYAGLLPITRGAAVGDIDNDGTDDLVFAERSIVHVLRSNTGQELWSEDLSAGPGRHEEVPCAPLILDLDGDGRMDVFIVAGHGASTKEKDDSFGCAYALSGGARRPAPAKREGGWLLFRGGAIHSGCVTPAATLKK